MKNSFSKLLIGMMVLLLISSGMLFAAGAKEEAAADDTVTIVYIGFATSNTFWNRLGQLLKHRQMRWELISLT